MEQEQIMKIQMMEQEVNQLNQQSELLDQNIQEFEGLFQSLEEIENQENNEILANLGKKIYIPVEIKEKKLIVEVGNKNFVKKSIPETRNIIQEQIKNMISAKSEVSSRIETMHKEMVGMIQEIEKKGGVGNS